VTIVDGAAIFIIRSKHSFLVSLLLTFLGAERIHPTRESDHVDILGSTSSSSKSLLVSGMEPNINLSLESRSTLCEWVGSVIAVHLSSDRFYNDAYLYFECVPRMPYIDKNLYMHVFLRMERLHRDLQPHFMRVVIKLLLELV